MGLVEEMDWAKANKGRNINAHSIRYVKVSIEGESVIEASLLSLTIFLCSSWVE